MNRLTKVPDSYTIKPVAAQVQDPQGGDGSAQFMQIQHRFVINTTV